MRKTFITTLLFFTALMQSQNCKFEKEEVDEFTNKKIVVVRGSDIFRTSLITGLSFQVSKINESKFITFSLVSGKLFVLEKGIDKIMIKTKDNQILNIDFDTTVISDIVRNPTTGILYFAKQSVALSDNLFNELKNIEVVKVRIYTKEGYIEKEVKKKHSTNISDDLKCIE